MSSNNILRSLDCVRDPYRYEREKVGKKGGQPAGQEPN